MVDRSVAHGEHAVVQVHAAAGVIRDDLQVLADGGTIAESRDVDVAMLLIDVREICAGPPYDGAVAAVRVIVGGERL